MSPTATAVNAVIFPHYLSIEASLIILHTPSPMMGDLRIKNKMFLKASLRTFMCDY